MRYVCRPQLRFARAPLTCCGAGPGVAIETPVPGGRSLPWLEELQLQKGRKHGLQLCGRLHRRQPLFLVLIEKI